MNILRFLNETRGKEVSKSEWASLLVEITDCLRRVRNDWYEKCFKEIFQEYPAEINTLNYGGIDVIIKDFQLWLVASIFERQRYMPFPEGRKFLNFLLAQNNASLSIQKFNEACKKPRTWFFQPVETFVERIADEVGLKHNIVLLMSLCTMIPLLTIPTDLAIAKVFRFEEKIKKNG